MNINTCEAIRDLLLKWNEERNLISTITIDSSHAKGKWFYEMKITCKVTVDNYVVDHIYFVSKSIGQFFGEGLWHSISGEVLYLS